MTTEIEESEKLYCPNEWCKREAYVLDDIYRCDYCFSDFKKDELSTEGFKRYEYEHYPKSFTNGLHGLFDLLNKKKGKRLIQILDYEWSHVVIWENVRE